MVNSLEDFEKYPGNTLLEKVKSFVSEFEKEYRGESVPPIVFTAYQLAGKDTSHLKIDQYFEEK